MHLKKYTGGVLLTASVTLIAYLLADVPALKKFSLSPIILAILLGMLIKNTLGVRRYMRDGVKLCSKKVLRLAIILLGFKLSLAEVGALGLKEMGISKNLALLIGSGCSICGASAVIAVDAVNPNQKEEDVAFAIGVVTIFGTLFMLAYPLLFKAFSMNVGFYAMWTGLSIHEVAQVVAAGFAVSMEAGLAATVVKLTRVLFIIPVTLFLTLWNCRKGSGKFSLKNVTVPWFVLLFLGVIILNSVKIIPARPTEWLVTLDNYLMTGAMAALGLETSFGAMRKVGLKPVYLGVIASVFIAAFSAGIIWLF